MQAELERQANARRRAADLEERQTADEVVTWGSEFWGGVNTTGTTGAGATGLGLQPPPALVPGPPPGNTGAGGGAIVNPPNQINPVPLVPSAPAWMALMAVQAGLEPSAEAGADLQDGTADDDEEEGLEDMLEVEQLNL
jgi:hypothetical protein